MPRVSFDSSKTHAPLQRTHHLFREFSSGAGELTPVNETPPPPLLLADGVQARRLPWEVDPGREESSRLVTWTGSVHDNDENMLAIVLRDGQSWCSARTTFRPGARVRFEAASIERARPASLEIRLDGADESSVLSSERLAFPGSLSASRQTDVEIGGRGGRLCFRATGGAAAIGEARVLAPTNDDETRPRWLILTIVDALRADVLRTEEKERQRVMPALSALTARGQHYENAIAPGCHTRASVWPILMGRDLMRIDPLKRRQSMPIQSPLEDIYSRANLFVSHLAENAGYHSVFLGNNAYLKAVPAFSRYSSWGNTDTGTMDTIAALPALFDRYRDEPVLLVYYVSTPHAQSKTPRRWFDAFGCAELTGIEQCRCNYLARARHADEALEFLRQGLEASGLGGETFEIITADHGELFDDGMLLEGEMPTFTTSVRRGVFKRFGRGHGNGCHFRETDVPLIVYGRDVEPARVGRRVSGLDIVPTLLRVMDQAVVSRLDGKALPVRGVRPVRSAERDLVTYGFCSDSIHRGDEQVIWWTQGCQLREPGSETLSDYRSELWVGEQQVATETTQPTRLRRAMARHEIWLRERLPSEAVVFHTANLPAGATVTLTLEDDDDDHDGIGTGMITDFGPARTVFGLDRIALIEATDRAITVRFDGYKGLYYFSTLPARAPVRVFIENHGEPVDTVRFIGPMQLPLDTAGRAIAPDERPSFFVSDNTPTLRKTDAPALQIWWHPYGVATSPDDGANPLSDFDRVLREWGYIR